MSSETGSLEISASESLARIAYDAYCVSVGGKAFNGDLLFHSSVFFTDPASAKQAKAWVDSIVAVETKLAQPAACRDPETGSLPDTETPALAHTRLAKQHRADLDAVLQAIKAQKQTLCASSLPGDFEDRNEVIAQLTLAQRDVESGIMRLGMVLKNIGATPNPYPKSYDPTSPVIEKTADGVKL